MSVVGGQKAYGSAFLWSQLQCCCIDADPAAVSLARENAQILGLSDRAVFAVGRLTDKDGIQGKLPFELSRRFDIVVSNPPYIPTAELSFLAPEIKQLSHTCRRRRVPMIRILISGKIST